MQEVKNTTLHILPEHLLADEDYILSRYITIFKKKDILTVEDLLLDFPVKYEDFSVHSINDAVLDEPTILEGTIVSKVTVNYLKSKLSTVVFQLDVEGIKIRCTLFNRIYLKGKLNYGSVIRVQGKFYQNMNNFTVSNLVVLDEINRDIIPTYRIKDISESKYLELMSVVYRKHKDEIIETLPKDYIEKHNLLSLKDAIKIMHLSDNLDEIKKAQELLKYQVSMKYLHYMRQKEDDCPAINYDVKLLEKLKNSLSYELTIDQEKAIRDILADLKAHFAMNRLLQGEVGSGKTIVAIMTILATVSGGYQAALMCPTEILSKQHYDTLRSQLEPFDNINIALLTGSTPLKEKRQILEGLQNGTINIVVGTHALFQKDVEYYNLGTVIADEEHRFGVRQRVLIKNKGLDVNYLKMSATPIPRTLAISAYGDTDISIIKTMPKNRKAVITKYVDKEHKREVMDHIKNELKNGHQIYVVTPLIEESEVLDTANATKIYENMKQYFAGIATVGLIHGKLKPDEKEKIMQEFLNNEIQILVATSVIEVGVNVVNATTILVLGAERFGVATLHQLRGRIGRNSLESTCILIGSEKNERLSVLASSSDGFYITEKDYEMRKEGDIFGVRQSGDMSFKIADIKRDFKVLMRAKEDSLEFLEKNDKNIFKNDEKYIKIIKEIESLD